MQVSSVRFSATQMPQKAFRLKLVPPDFGQLIAEFPVLYFLHKLPIRTFVAVSIMVWAVVVACQAAAHSFAGMATVRFFVRRFPRVLCSPCAAVFLLYAMFCEE